MDAFQEWINRKYLDWRGETRRTVSEFAAYLNISQPTMNAWINGSRGKPTSQKIVKKLVDYYGREACDVLGISYPPDDRSKLSDLGFPPEFIERLLLARAEYSSELASKGISIDSPAAREIINTALSKFGIHLIETK